MSDLPAVTVDEGTAAGVRNGLRYVAGPIVAGPDDEPFCVLDRDGELLAVYRKVGEAAQPEVVLPA